MGFFPSSLSHKIFLQEFPIRISRKIFLQEFSARFSRKIFPSQILLGWLPITLFQMLNFHQSLPFFNLLFPLLPVPQDFPVRFFCKNFTQDFPARISCKIFPKDFPARFSCRIFLNWILTGWLPITLFQMLNFHQSLPFLNWLFPLLPVPQDFPARICRKIFLQDFSELDPDWLAPHHPIPNAKFPPITAFLKFAFCPPPCSTEFPAENPGAYPATFQAAFPTRFFHKNFPQDFPGRFSQAGS